MRFAKPLRLFRIWDLFLLIIIFALLGVALFFFFGADKGGNVEIYVNGEKYMTVSLSRDRVIELDDLTVVVKDGAVYVENADCKDKICEHTGSISKKGQTIVCAPNRVVIRITGKKGDVEAIT